MSNAWGPFYWRDYVAGTGHLTLDQHGAYLLLMAHYYMTARPIPANAEQVHRICRCTTVTDKRATDAVLAEFFVLEGDIYRHGRIDKELVKAADISGKRRAAANTKHQKSDANAPASAGVNGMQKHTQPQPQSQPQIQKRGNEKKCPLRVLATSLARDLNVSDSLGNLTSIEGAIRNEADSSKVSIEEAVRIICEAARGDGEFTTAKTPRFYFEDGAWRGSPSYRSQQHAGKTPKSERFEHRLPSNLDKDAGDLAWQAILEKLGPPRVDKHSFDTWLKPARAAGIRGKSLYVTLPTPDFAGVPEKYGALIAEVVGGDLRVELVVPELVAC